MPLSANDYHTLAGERGFAWVGAMLPANVHTPTEWRCDSHNPPHIWSACYGSIQQGTGCPLCAECVPKSAEDYHALAVERGFAWVGATPPANIGTSTKWRCDKHDLPHTWTARYGSIQQGTGCPLCVECVLKSAEDYHALAGKRGFAWIGQELPVNTDTPTEWRCDRHNPPHTWAARYGNIQQGTGCPLCAELSKFGRSNRRKESEDYHDLAGKRGFAWVGAILPANTQTPTEWRCEKHDPPYIWSTRYSAIRRGTGCPLCAECAPKSAEDYHALAVERGFAWIGQELPVNTVTPTEWRCDRHDPPHIWAARYNAILRGTDCPLCAECVPKSAEDYHALAVEHGFAWVGAILPANTKTPTEWRCDRHNPPHTWAARYNSIQQGSGCPLCARVRAD